MSRPVKHGMSRTAFNRVFNDLRRRCNNPKDIQYSIYGGRGIKCLWEKIVGYSIQELMDHLEKQFNDKMNWNNYGSYWHVDHKKPITWFKYTDYSDIEFKECWSLNNLQPLERIENIKKGNRYATI